MILNDDLQRVPNLGAQALDHLARSLDIAGSAGLHEPFHNKRLEKLDRHLLRQTALIHLQLRSDNDNGTAGVVDTFTEKVLTEASLLTSEHFRQRLERAV